MTKYLIGLCCFLFIQKAKAQDEKSLSNQVVFDIGAGVSAAYITDVVSKKIGNSLIYTPVAEIFVKKYFSVQLGEVKIPLYVAGGAMVHLSSNPSKPIMPQVRLGPQYRGITAFLTRVWQKAATSDFPGHHDNKNYWGYGLEFNRRFTRNGVLYLSMSKNDRHVITMISIGFIF